MPEDLFQRYAIDSMVTEVEHNRDCERCRRVYGAAFDVLRQERGYEPHPWRVLTSARGSYTNASTGRGEYECHGHRGESNRKSTRVRAICAHPLDPENLSGGLKRSNSATALRPRFA